MSRLKDRQRQIPNGFQFALPELGYKSSPFASFDSIVNSVHTVIKSNPSLAAAKGWPAERSDVADWVDNFNAQWCERNGWHDYIVGRGESSPPKSIPLPGLRLAVAGAKTLADWIGEGAMPVSSELAELRAGICVKCPLNQPGDMADFFTRGASEILRRQIENARGLELVTTHDDKLGVCSACTCPLRLKIHSPLSHIVKHLLPEARAALDKNCWITHE